MGAGLGRAFGSCNFCLEESPAHNIDLEYQPTPIRTAAPFVSPVAYAPVPRPVQSFPPNVFQHQRANPLNSLSASVTPTRMSSDSEPQNTDPPLGRGWARDDVPASQAAQLRLAAQLAVGQNGTSSKQPWSQLVSRPRKTPTKYGEHNLRTPLDFWVQRPKDVPELVSGQLHRDQLDLSNVRIRSCTAPLSLCEDFNEDDGGASAEAAAANHREVMTMGRPKPREVNTVCDRLAISEKVPPMRDAPEPAFSSTVEPLVGSPKLMTLVVSQDRLCKARALSEGVVLFCEETTKGCFQYHVFNKKLSRLELNASLKGSKNAAWDDASASSRVSVVAPTGVLVEVGTVKVADSRAASSIKLTLDFKHTRLERTKEVAVCKRELDRVLAEQTDKMNSLGIKTANYSSAELIRRRCAAAKVKFVDVTFPPTEQSLYEPGKEPAEAPPIIWRRPSEFCADSGGEPVIYTHIQSDHLKEGALGNSWFLSALGALTEFRGTIEGLLDNCVENEQGVYEVTCWKNGQATTVIIDDLIPCSPFTGQPVFSHTHTNELWVCILEKAWAKLHGSYQRLDAGIAYQALMDLLCQPGSLFPLTDGQEDKVKSNMLFSRLKAFDTDGCLMCATTLRPVSGGAFSGSQEEVSKMGLVPGQGYTLKSVVEVHNQQLLCLRNVSSDFEWNGDWSDSSDKWTPQLRKALRYKPKSGDGLFWMSADDFFTYFESVHICHVKANSSNPWSIALEIIPVCGDSPNCGRIVSALHFEVRHNMTGFASLWQADERQSSNPPYSSMPYAIYGPLGEPGSVLPREVLRSEGLKQREEINHIKNLPPGKYLVAVWNVSAKTSQNQKTTATFMLHLCRTNPPDGYAEAVQGLSMSRLEPGSGEMVARVGAFCSATSGPLTSRQETADFECFTGWLPDRSHAIVFRSKRDELFEVTIDYGASRGLSPVGSALANRTKGEQGPSDDKCTATLHAGQVVLGGEFQPKAGVSLNGVSAHYDLSWPRRIGD